MKHPFVRLVAPLVLGLVLGLALHGSGLVVRLAVYSSLAAVCVAVRRHRPLLIASAALGLGALVTGFCHARPSPSTLRLPWRAPVLVDGTLDGPLRRDGDGHRLMLRDLRLRPPGRPWLATPGLARLSLPAGMGWHTLSEGDRIRVRARLHVVRPLQNPGVRDPARILLDRHIHFTGVVDRPGVLAARAEASALHRARDRARFRFRRWLDRAPCDRAARDIAQAVVLGDGAAIEPVVRDAWRRAGLSHLLAISGLHVGLFAWVVFRLVTWIFAAVPAWSARRPAAVPGALVAILAAWAYVGIAGAPISAVRAGWMLTGLLGARLVLRGPDPASALALAALCVTVHDPLAIVDPAAQLSFGAIGALALGAGPLGRWTRRIRDEAPYPLLARGLAVLAGGLGASLLCTLGTLPFVVWHFQSLPLAGLCANVVAIPLAAWGIVIPGMGSLVLVTFRLDPLADLASRWMEIGFSLTHGLAVQCAEWAPPVSLSGAGPLEVVGLGTACLLAVCALRSPRPRWRLRLGAASVLLLTTVTLGRQLPSAGSGELQITFLAVGHGDSTVVQLPDGTTFLVDAGGDATGRRDVGARVMVPALRALGVDRVDVLVLTHPHPDHYAGMLAVVGAMEVGELWSTGLEADDPVFRALMQALDARGVPRRSFGRDRTFQLGDVRIELLHPPPRPGRLSVNDQSLVIRFRLGEFSLLTTGDIEAPAEAMLVGSGADLRATVLKVPHHGSATSSSEPFLRAVRPRLAVAQCEDGGRFGFPRPEVSARYRALGIPLWITGRQGALQLRTDGHDWAAVHTW